MHEQCDELPSRRATESELELCHPPEYIDKVKQYKSKTLDELLEESKNPHSVYFHWDTYECASFATGCLLSVLDNVCTKKVKDLLLS